MYCIFVRNLGKKYGYEVSLVDTSLEEEVKKSWKENTKMVYLETPANPTCKISDICGIDFLFLIKIN